MRRKKLGSFLGLAAMIMLFYTAGAIEQGASCIIGLYVAPIASALAFVGHKLRGWN